jgi:hypothetical protein
VHETRGGGSLTAGDGGPQAFGRPIWPTPPTTLGRPRKALRSVTDAERADAAATPRQSATVVTLDDAIGLIRGAPLAGTAATWADLGCGDGTFTLALATLLPPGSTIHAMDRNASALRRIPRKHGGSSILTHVGDFTTLPWPFEALDGVLLGNSLHYVRDQCAFIRFCEPAMNHPRQFLIVEYDTESASRWVPHPLGFAALVRLFTNTGYSVYRLGAHPSIYRRAPIYGAWVAAQQSAGCPAWTRQA